MITSEFVELAKVAKEIVDSMTWQRKTFESLSAYRTAILETIRELKEASVDRG